MFATARRRCRIDDDSWDMQDDCQALLAARGYAQYEVSAYARAGRRCPHNLNYWRFGDYLGIGAGAHGKLTTCDDGERDRAHRARQASARATCRAARRRARQRACDVAARGAAVRVHAQCAAAGRRLRRGRRSRRAPACRARRSTRCCAAAQRDGLLEQASTRRLAADELGQRFLNDLQALFLPERVRATGAAMPTRRRATACIGAARKS